MKLPNDIICKILSLLPADISRCALVCKLWAYLTTSRKTTQIIHCDVYSLMFHTYTYDKLCIYDEGRLWFYYYCYQHANFITCRSEAQYASYCKRAKAKFTMSPFYTIQIELPDSVGFIMFARYDKVKYSVVVIDSNIAVYKSPNYMNILSYSDLLVKHIDMDESDDVEIAEDIFMTNDVEDLFDTESYDMWLDCLVGDEVLAYMRDKK